MSNSWIFVLIIAVISTAAFVGFEFYNSITEQNVEFNGRVFAISTDLGDEVLEHIEDTSQDLPYKGDEN